MRYTLSITVEADDDAEARLLLGEAVTALSLDNDDYEWGTSIINADTKQKVSIYSPDYPQDIRQNPEA